MSTVAETASFIDRLLTRNYEWADGLRRMNPHTLKHLADDGQKPGALWIGCSDSRVPESVVTASVPGDIFVHRNIANQFSAKDINAASALQFAVENLHVAYVAVVGHTKCGGVTAALRDATPPCTRQNPVLGEWLANLTQLAKDLGLTYPEGLERLTEENVKNAMTQVKGYLEGLSAGQFEDAEGSPPRIAQVIIVGMIYDLETGDLREVGERIVVGVRRRKVTPGVEEYSAEMSD